MKVVLNALVLSILWLPLAGGIMAAPGTQEPPEALYRLYCVQCHGTKANGKGINRTVGKIRVAPMDHTSAESMSRRSDRQLKLAITKGGDPVGKSELMPGWGEVLTEVQIDSLVVYLRKLCKCSFKKKK